MPRPSKHWPKSFFRSEVFSPGQPEAVAMADDEARFLIKALKLRRGSRLLDVCCGTGRHDFALAKKGIEVVGADITPEYLEQARSRAGRAANPRFIQADMRELPFEMEFDAAMNVWTSFGYFLDPRDDARALRSIALSIKPGGLFLIDLINGDWIREKGYPRNWRRRADGAYVLEELELVGGKDPGHISRWTILKKGQPAQRVEFWVRGYNRARLEKALRVAGMTPIRVWGGLDGARFERLSQRLVVLARTGR